MECVRCVTANLELEINGMSLQADDIEVGQHVIILAGEIVHVCSPVGCHEQELYDDLKGVPLAVLAIELPFMLVATIPFGASRLIDTRDVELMRCSQKWVTEFGLHVEVDCRRRQELAARSKQRVP